MCENLQIIIKLFLIFRLIIFKISNSNNHFDYLKLEIKNIFKIFRGFAPEIIRLLYTVAAIKRVDNKI